MSDKEATLNEIGKKALADTEKLATVQRFGLFSSPVPLGLGDNSYDNKPRPARNEQGKPITSPPNMKVTATQSGKIKSSYFSQLGFTTIGDKYIDPERKIRIQELEEKKKYANDDKKNFVPPSGYKELVGGVYNHEADYEIPKGPNNHKGGDGRVKIGPKNVTTNPGSSSLGHFPKHEKDEYNRYRQFEREKIFNEQKMLKDKQPFKSTIYTTDNFSTDKQIFGETNLPKPTQVKEFKPNIMKHEAPFKPSNPTKSGETGCLSKYPQYKGDPLKPTQRIDFVKGKDPFKPNHLMEMVRPTPSISCFPHNLKRELNNRMF
ncbi:unnamed protein product (macronuclear) [Paramecium tetraurelia]|uniref:Cilia-and flagella-associated protein 96 n=1 Tax=Paramecium tetraurelia TaxID=5888 RepID=A0CX61_PARTE|nr:uncharacterized protein GSPATT00001582001 [Paramecium tetraurelia]CAK75378.1 unnamed protein product [Paramecium tetraurelia]|eukprot:XP_001442775.1 hypothetical protein (macronuclear) [Paramecium tetraurelia strain d4-2]